MSAKTVRNSQASGTSSKVSSFLTEVKVICRENHFIAS
jgi:hypothetical protein